MKSPVNVLILSLLLFGIGVLAFGSYSAFNMAKLLRYLKKERYLRWEELTSIGKFGPGLNNVFRSLPYIYSKLDNEDEKIAKLKGNVRIGNRYLILTLIAFFVNNMLICYFK
ncbi:MAG: hypothetical protein ACOYU4_04710 [Thermodesulfobacteriota bacterium]